MLTEAFAPRAQPVNCIRMAHCSAKSPGLESLTQKKTRWATALTVSRNRGYPPDGGVCGLFSCLLTVFSYVFSVFSSDDPGVFTLFSFFKAKTPRL